MRRWLWSAGTTVHAAPCRRQSTALGPQPTLRPQSASAQRPSVLPRRSHAVDPYKIVTPELSHIRRTLLHLLGSSHPSLTQVAEYYFLRPSKQIRPLLVLLFARATNGLGAGWARKRWQADCEGAGGRAEELDRPLTRADVLNDWNPNMPDHTASFDTIFALRPPRRYAPPPLPLPTTEERVPKLTGQILPTQTRLAQILEMIHVASLLHDDVLDASPLRRGAPSAPAQFGNKLSVLAGDFLLGRASAALSRLGESEVVELIATVIANLVEGEILQAKSMSERQFHAFEGGMAAPTEGAVAEDDGVTREEWGLYLKKSYLKSASLLAKGARAAVILGGAREGEIWKEIAYAYGRNIGIAFQLVDDALDYMEGEGDLGKPRGADLELGLATAPALFAWEEHEGMGPLIRRNFREEGDVEMAREFVRQSKGVERTRDLARTHAIKAREVLGELPDSDAKVALEILTENVVQRSC